MTAAAFKCFLFGHKLAQRCFNCGTPRGLPHLSKCPRTYPFVCLRGCGYTVPGEYQG